MGSAALKHSKKLKKPRQSFTVESKLRVLKKMSDEGLKIRQAAKVIGVHESVIRNWKESREKYERIEKMNRQNVKTIRSKRTPEEA
jgi:transposase